VNIPKHVAAKKPKTRRVPPSTSGEIVYETPKKGFIPGIEEEYDDDTVKEEEEETYCKEEKEDVGSEASPPYMGRDRHFLDTQDDIRKDCEQLIVGDPPVFIDTVDKFTIKGTAFRCSNDLGELL